jgi:tyrosinase
MIQISLAAALAPTSVTAQPPAKRIGWAKFAGTPAFANFVKAVGAMRQNTAANDPASWQYWANIHQNSCPHGKPYLLAWHRGYLHLFEQQLRKVAADPTLSLPYWDYYGSDVLPAEFTAAGPDNPLYVPRIGSSVSAALGVDAFAPGLKGFQRGVANAFEPVLERLPHNQVHNLIGGKMASMQSPQDPIFWLHHSNIDRLWVAWLAAGDGRAQPPAGDPYWSGTFDYGPAGSLPRQSTYDTLGALGYAYDDLTLPARPKAPVPIRPPVRQRTRGGIKVLGGSFLALGEAGNVSLDERSFSIEVPVPNRIRNQSKALLSNDRPAPGDISSLSIAFDDVRVTAAGGDGGYFYKVYVNLPARPDASLVEPRFLIGTIGAFEIAAARHADHAGHGEGVAAAPLILEFPATAILQAQGQGGLDKLVVSVVRFDGENAPKGAVIEIRNFRVVASTAAVE